MSKKNYRRYSKMGSVDGITTSTYTAEEPVEIITEEGAVTSTEFVTDNEVSVEAETDVEIEVGGPVIPDPVINDPFIEPKVQKLGKVFNCTKLNVRELPSKSAKVVSELPADTEVLIDVSASTAVFYKVCTERGVEGYCMKDYVKIPK